MLIISLIILLILPSISTNSLGNQVNLSVKNSSLKEEYVIEGVPYTAQEDFGCLFADLDMIFRYYGKNSSLAKNIFYNGIPYSYVYQRKIESFTTLPIPNPPYYSSFWWSTALGQGVNDYSFLASQYGLNMSVSYPQSVVFNHYKAWNEWWDEVKSFIVSNSPVCTGINPLAWPIYLEAFNITSPLPGRAGHAVLIVGYNERNNTICVQDSAAGSEKYHNPNRIGYQWISLPVFKTAIKRSYWEFSENSYWIIAVDNVSETPDFDYAFKTAHDRNIERLKGNKSFYDKIYLDNFEDFGINALYKLKDQFGSLRFWILFPFFRIVSRITELISPKNSLPFEWTAGGFRLQALEQDYVSDFLKDVKSELKDENLSKICDHDSILLENSSKKFFELSNLTFDLQDSLDNTSIIKTISEVYEILQSFVGVLDELISIQEAIIAGPGEDI